MKTIKEKAINQKEQFYKDIVDKYDESLKLHMLKYPIKVDAQFKEDTHFEVSDKQDVFELRDEFQQVKEEIIELKYKNAIVYDNTNIRVDNWSFNNNTFALNTSRTTYFNSLATNRAMDYECKNGLKVRDIELGQSLETSTLSNHLGFNGFVITSDGYVPFVKRGSNLSVGANTLGPSVGASMKTKYALTNNELTYEGIVNSMKKEIKDELNIDEECISNLQITMAYRDYVEGGKPQLLFVATTSLTKDELQEKFARKVKEDLADKKLVRDGKELVYVDKEMLSTFENTLASITFGKDTYEIVPQVGATLKSSSPLILKKIQQLEAHNILEK